MSSFVTPPAARRPRRPEDVPDGYELVDGKLRRLPMATISSWIERRLFLLLNTHCESRRAGFVFLPDTAYRCFPSKPTQVRKPDVSVIAADPTTYVPPPVGILDVVPLLVAEVVSPKERAKDLASKIYDFRSVKTPLIWVIDPELRQATIYRADGSVSLVADPGDLSGEGVLPGLVIPLAAVLPPAAAAPPA